MSASSAPRLLLLVTASSPLRSLHLGLAAVRRRGAEVWVGASPDALPWLDEAAVVADTGHPLLNAGGPLPAGHPTVCVAPATFNTVNKLASGVADTLVTAVAAEAVGLGSRVVVAPSFNTALLAHPVAQESRRRLESYGVHLLWPETGNDTGADGDDGDGPDVVEWWEAVVARCELG